MSDSSLLELLSVTDKAVKALNKSQSSRSSQGSDVSLTSQRSHTKDSGIKSQTENIRSKIEKDGADLSDVSTTASDVLIRSTIIDEQQKSPSSVGSTNGAKLSSSDSKCSRTSIGVENFNSSGPQKVKISTKKLREIQSPVGSDIISPRSDIISPPLVTQKHRNLGKSDKVLQEKPLVTRHFTGDSDFKLQKKQGSKKSFPPSNVVSLQDQNESQNNANSSDYKKPSVDKNLGIDSPVTPDDIGVSPDNIGGTPDYMGVSPDYKNGEVFIQSSEKGSNDSHDVIVERHAPKITHPTKETLMRDNEETDRIRRKLLELEDSIDLIPQKETGNAFCMLVFRM